ncbi:hypothetical protein LO762_27020 [Actinocorallia sp. API 0066]|uniref:hypothetical protein n=1 Tax=Actinocorallia sp. API 0066 TaxID=2896846 RepID=UPI001E2CF3EF|nr:hypothetical protein [Actinocorallia sp. API 0066]MCD0452806.1 hypothetical protein [Actinocorallia sp. API 0066]
MSLAVLEELARRCAFGDLAALARAGHAPRTIEGTAEFGHQLLQLDAEDFGVAHPSVPRALVDRARAVRVPQEPGERHRGALGSMRAGFRLLLEVIAVHWARRELGGVVAAAHIAAEYLTVLAWEPVLGHAADPARLPDHMKVAHSRFGVVAENASCAHTRGLVSACERSLRVAGDPPEGWRNYLDRQHTTVIKALSVCAFECKSPCAVTLQVPEAPRGLLSARSRLAREYSDGAFVRLRHAAPVGHGFGVPSEEEVLDAWSRSLRSLNKHALFRDQPEGPDFPIPHLPRLFSAVAGVPLTPDTLLADTSTHLIHLLHP